MWWTLYGLLIFAGFATCVKDALGDICRVTNAYEHAAEWQKKFAEWNDQRRRDAAIADGADGHDTGADADDEETDDEEYKQE